MQDLLANYDNQGRLHQLLRESGHLHAPFLEHVGGHAQPSEPPQRPEGVLDFALRHAPQQLVQRFLFAHFLSGMLPEPPGPELTIAAVQRGRFMELVADESRMDFEAGAMYMAGALSSLDALTGLPLDVALHCVEAPDRVRDVLLADSREHSPERELLQLAGHIENGDWDACEPLLAECNISGERAAMLYGKAAIWTWMLLG